MVAHAHPSVMQISWPETRQRRDGLASKFKGSTRMRRMQRIKRMLPCALNFPLSKQQQRFLLLR
jgi:hypothetical protein